MSFYEDEETRQREAALLNESNEDEADPAEGDRQATGAKGKGGRRDGAPDPSGYYKTLGVSPTASPQEIRKAFLYLSQRYHTDKHADQVEAMREAMNSRFQELQEAYTVLADEKQRAAYDAAGKRGADRLALVPATLTRRKDIMSYILTLDREAELVKTARMLSATSDITLTYSTTALFLTPAIQQQVLGAAGAAAPELPKSMTANNTADEPKRESGSGAAAVPSSSPSPTTSGSHAEDGSATSNNPGKGKGATTAESTKASPLASAGKPVHAQMTAKEVTVDGRKQIVLIPNEEMQSHIRDRMRAAGVAAGDTPEETQAVSRDETAGGGGATAKASGFFSGSRVVMGRTVSVPTAMFISAVPTALVFRHSFQHSINRRTALLFRTDARSERGRAQVSMTTSVEFQRDGINTYAAMLRATTGGLKLTVVKDRVLNPLYTLRAKLVCLNAGVVLQKLELALTRKLSETVELTNTIAWSIFEYGFFSSRVARTWKTGSQGVSAFISYHNMTLTAFTASAVTYGTDTHDPKHPPARGRVQYSVNCSPFSGQTQTGFEAWYYHAPLQHYGIGFTTVIPYAFSPAAPPLFFVESSQYAVVNQVSFLYARGQHRISIPIVVFVSPRVSQALLWLGVPVFCYRAARIVYKPYAKAKAARYYAQCRREHLAEMDVARERACLEQRALELLILQSRAAEDRKGGLVIVNAQYGVLSPEYMEGHEVPNASMASPTTRKAQRKTRHAPPLFSRLLELGGDFLHRTFSGKGRGRRPRSGGSGSGEHASSAAADEGTYPSTAPPGEQGEGNHSNDDDGALDIPLSLDVTIALQNLVRDSALVLPAGTKSGLVGFCDPDPFTPERKQLKVTYWFRKKKHCAIFDDEDLVELPQREHRVD